MKKISKVKVIKDMPGAPEGSEFKVRGCGVIHGGTGTELRGANIGKKFYYSSEFESYPDFFFLFYETNNDDESL